MIKKIATFIKEGLTVSEQRILFFIIAVNFLLIINGFICK